MTPGTTPTKTYGKASFETADLAECDVIMKGGVTSGIVYPYAVLEIATRYRFRSLGGTSAGAIAAAFAAAAEYARSVRADAEGFVRLQAHCEALPGILPDLFQPDPAYAPALGSIRRIMAAGPRAFVRRSALRATLMGAAAAIVVMLVVRSLSGDPVAIVLAALLGLLVGSLAYLGFALGMKLLVPVARGIAQLPHTGFGGCSGLTVAGAPVPALTDWLHAAIQDIAFGADKRDAPLTFGDLERTPDGVAPIQLRMVTTNLSLARPHTLPDLGIPVGYDPEDWARLFPRSVMLYLNKTSSAWRQREGVRRLPQGDDLPVIVAMRMSLSFPLLFKAIPVWGEDFEYAAVIQALGGEKPERRICRMWLTDGGLSSNFPVHLFDAPLPTRPTFAISLDELQCAPGAVRCRVRLPQKAIDGIGVQVREIETLRDFGWQILASAKDWQDQLSSEMTGQRERVARVFLAPDEGGLNLTMPEERSRALMNYGLEAGRLFVTKFDFDEHRWRRMLAVHRTATEWLGRGQDAWAGGFADWYGRYSTRVKTYKSLSPADRKALAEDVGRMIDAGAASDTIPLTKFPKRVGQLRITPRY